MINPGNLAETDSISGPPPHRIWAVLFALMVAAYVSLVWAYPYFPSQDGPIHLEIAAVLAQYDNPDYPVLAQYFERHWSLQRNPFSYVVLGVLAKAMPMLVAEKVYLSLIVALFPFSLYYLLRKFTPDAVYLAFAAFPLSYSFTLMKGFYSFSLAISLFLLTVGLWLRLRERWTAMGVGLFSGAVIATYAVHIFAAFNVLYFVGLATIWEIATRFLADPGGRNLKSLWRILLARGIPPLIAVLPVLAIILAFMTTTEAMPGSVFSTQIRLLWFLLMSPALTFAWHDSIISIGANAVLLTLVGFVIAEKWKAKTASIGQFWFIFLCYFALMLLVPTPAPGSAYILERLTIYAFIVLIVALASTPLPRQFLPVGAALLVLFSTANLANRYWQHERANDYIAEYMSVADLVAPNSTLLSLTVDRASTDRKFAMRLRPLVHAAGYIVVDRNVVDLTNFQAGHGNFFPLAYRPSLNPYQQLSSGLEYVPPPNLSLKFPDGSGGSVDYVVILGALEKAADHPETQNLIAQLDRGYELIMVSSPRQLSRLYRRVGLAVEHSDR